MAKLLRRPFGEAKMPKRVKRAGLQARKAAPPHGLVLEDMRKDFSRQVFAYAESLQKNPFSDRPLPAIRETSFAKKPGFTARENASRRFPAMVFSHKPKPGERIGIHSHTVTSVAARVPMAEIVSDMQSSVKLSIADMLSLVQNVNSAKKASEAIYVVETGPSYGKVFSLINRLRSKAAWSQAEGKSPQLTSHEADLLKLLGMQAASEFVVSGMVFAKPTKNLAEMMGPKRIRLMEFLDSQLKELRRIRNETPGNAVLSKQSRLNMLYRDAEENVLKAYGKIFRLRFVPMPGYRFDKRLKIFTKA
jgi:hypothetical protein